MTLRRLILAAALLGALSVWIVGSADASPKPPLHGIGTAVLKTNYRGGHAVAVHPSMRRLCS